MWATIEAGHIWEGEFCNRRKDGSEYWEFAVITPITDEAGQVVKYVGVKHNITEHKEHAKADQSGGNRFEFVFPASLVNDHVARGMNPRL